MSYTVRSRTKSLLGTTDLTVIAPVKAGLCPAIDARSYESRLRLLLGTVGGLRVSSKEIRYTNLIDDAVDRIRGLHSFRLGLITKPGERTQLLLAVTFDGGWEPYMRRIWRDLGPLLDVIFCNCEGYLLSTTNSYEAYIGWVRASLVEVGFFYNATELTVNDLQYLRKREAQRFVVPGVQGVAVAQATPAEKLAQIAPGLVALHRLADMYLPDPLGPKDGDDADVLLRASELLFGEAGRTVRASWPLPNPHATAAERAAIDWFMRAKEPLPPVVPAEKADRTSIQGGILDPYPPMTHGCLLLVNLRDAAAAQALLAHLREKVTTAQDQVGQASLGMPCVNVSFTLQGLEVTGVPRATLDQMPFEFREGMSARASILGDRDYNHPTNWEGPERNWPQGTTGRVKLTSVHVLVQFVTEDYSANGWAGDIHDPGHPLHGPVQKFDAKLRDKGVSILSAQLTQRLVQNSSTKPRGHFGFVDGVSQPLVGDTPPPVSPYPNHVPLGDVLLGHVNSRGDPVCPHRLWDDGSFMVMRKLAQHVDAFHDLLARARAATNKTDDDIKTWLMGRKPDGGNLFPPAQDNNFDYEGDPHGTTCRFQSHVRRANPRTLAKSRPDQVDAPRIVRRGMSYGPAYQTDPKAERGLIFTAYNASIAEQFEVIQGWLSGGNSSTQDSYSGLRDPFVGVPGPATEPHCFVFDPTQGPAGAFPLDRAHPLVTLKWGLYAFVPSIKALTELHDLAREAAAVGSQPATQAGCPFHQQQRKNAMARERSALVQRGALAIGGLELIERTRGVEAAKTQWKIALEDVSARMDGFSQAIWAAVRELHGGVLRTPYGVLVCSRALADQVFANAQGYYSVSGYNERLRRSFGEIYLGKDAGAGYGGVSTPINKAIFAISARTAFAKAREAMVVAVQGALVQAPAGEVEVKDMVDAALAQLCVHWFGVPQSPFVEAGGWRWGSNQVTCPGYFHAPSRYTFQPNPGPDAAQLGQDHGRALKAKLLAMVGDQGGRNAIKGSPLGGAVAQAAGQNHDLLVRNLIGVMMGMLPTVDGNLRSVLYEWVADASLWDHQIAYLAAAKRRRKYVAACEAVLPPLVRTMRLRPVPEVVWRTAVKAHSFVGGGGVVEVRPGDIVVVSQVSAGQQELLEDADPNDLSFVFGGRRSAPVAPPGEPLHACPAQKMATGVLLGLLAGLMESATWRPTLSPLSLKVGPP